MTFSSIKVSMEKYFSKLLKKLPSKVKVGDDKEHAGSGSPLQ